MRHLAAFLVFLPLLLVSAVQAAETRGHAHNDYEHARPLLDALEAGFGSVEADIWLEDGALLVGHDQRDLDPARTLQTLYLDPLQERADSGEVSQLILLIDIKSGGEETYKALSDVLAGYAGMLSRVEDGQRVPGVVTAIVSGNRPKATMMAEEPRYAFYDGRLGDLASGLSADFMPLVSDNWTKFFSWRGSGEMPANEQEKLSRYVEAAHAAGYRLRFWETPDAPGPDRDALWTALAEAGVDFINTDDLSGLAAFLTKQ